MDKRKPSEWSREERDRPVTQEGLWYELDGLRSRTDTKLTLLGRKGMRAARFPEPGWDDDRARNANRFFVVVIALTWALIIVTIVITKTR
jgi:hypothetical protein